MLRYELEQFAAHLSPSVRRLFRSNFLQGVSDSLANIFIGAFIWYTTGSFIAVALYYLAQFTLQPLIFGLNGFLLRYWHIRFVFFFGAVLAGASVLAVVVFADTQNMIVFLLLGCLRAVGHGFYWPNRNYLELQEVSDGSRNYYFGLIHAAGGVISVLVPFVAGWFIAFGPYTGGYSSLHAYWAIFMVSFLIMFTAGYIVIKGEYDSPVPKQITRFSVRPFLNKRRVLNLTMGMVNGLIFIIPLLVLMLLGNEGVLGTLTAAAALCVAGCMYLFGRFADKNRRYQLALISSLVFFGCALALIVLPHPLNVLVYVLFAKGATDFLFVGVEPILLAHSDTEMNGEAPSRYSFIFDNEFFLNFGRVCSIALALVLAFFSSQLTAILYTPLVVGVIQLSLLGFAHERNIP